MAKPSRRGLLRAVGSLWKHNTCILPLMRHVTQQVRPLLAFAAADCPCLRGAIIPRSCLLSPALHSPRSPPPPVAQRDPRWERLGLGVPRPRLRDLLAAHRQLCVGRVEVVREGEGGAEYN